jgi:hypothetical protein
MSGAQGPPCVVVADQDSEGTAVRGGSDE